MKSFDKGNCILVLKFRTDMFRTSDQPSYEKGPASTITCLRWMSGEEYNRRGTACAGSPDILPELLIVALCIYILIVSSELL